MHFSHETLIPMHADQYCQDILRQSKSSFYWTIRLLRPPDKRRALTALYAWCRQLDDVVDQIQEPSVAEIKLNWWHQEIQRLFNGSPTHPITTALSSHLHHYSWQKIWFEDLITAMQMDLQKKTYADFQEVYHYAHGAAGVVGQLSAEVFSYTDPQTLNYAHELGIAFQLTNMIRDVGEDVRRGRCYLPLDELDDAGVDWEAFSSRYESSPAFIQLMKHQVVRARSYYQKAFSLLPSQDLSSQKPGLLMAAIYQRLLDELEKEGLEHVLHQRLSLTWRSKISAVWSRLW
jgi:phytoene synthase